MAFIALTEEVVSELVTESPQLEVYDSAFPGPGSFGVRVNRGGKKSYFLIYRLNGSRSRTTIGTHPALSLETARRRAIDILRRVQSGENPGLSNLRMKFREISELFLEHHVRPNLKPSTAQEYERVLRKELLPLWKNVDLSSIGSEEVAHFLTRVSLQRGSGIMANRIRAVVSSLFGFAVDRGLVASNPVPAAPPPAREKEGDRVLSFAELEILYRELASPLGPPPNSLPADILLFILLTGQQAGEVCAMRWGDIRLDLWSVGGISRHPSHDIFLVPAVMNRLRELRMKSGRYEYVFGTRDGGYVRHLGRYVAGLNSRLKFDRPFSPRDLRRTFQYRIRKLGVRPDVVEKLQARSSSVPKKLRPFQDYDYSNEVREALGKWADRITLSPPAPTKPDPQTPDGSRSGGKDSDGKKGAKIIQLFPPR